MLLKNKGLLIELRPYILFGLVVFGLLTYFNHGDMFPFVILSFFGYLIPAMLAIGKARSWIVRIFLVLFFCAMILLTDHVLSNSLVDSAFLTAFLMFAPPFVSLLSVISINYLEEHKNQ